MPSRRTPLPAPHPSRVRPIAASLLLATLAGHGELRGADPAAPPRGCRFLGWTDLAAWHQQSEPATGGWTLTSPTIHAGLPWDELVLSWNATTPAGSGLVFEAAPGFEQTPHRFYIMGRWAADPTHFRRESVPGQQDALAEVQTDTLVLDRPVERLRLRVRGIPAANGAQPVVRFLGVSLLNRESRPHPLPPYRPAWGKSLEVPQRSQADYPEGINEWCSPTSLSMVLAWWSRVLARKDLDRTVPEVARGVHDPAWPGTGNWPFNTAFAGTFPGIRAYVTRLTDVAEIEPWIAAGIPVIASVDYDRLRRHEDRGGSGHLVVVVGFTENGDVTVNDPGTRRRPRATFPREDFVAAWRHSRNTVYLVHPEDADIPEDRHGHWWRENPLGQTDPSGTALPQAPK